MSSNQKPAKKNNLLLTDNGIQCDKTKSYDMFKGLYLEIIKQVCMIVKFFFNPKLSSNSKSKQKHCLLRKGKMCCISQKVERVLKFDCLIQKYQKQFG